MKYKFSKSIAREEHFGKKKNKKKPTEGSALNLTIQAGKYMEWFVVAYFLQLLCQKFYSSILISVSTSQLARVFISPLINCTFSGCLLSL